MPGYLTKMLQKFKHISPAKPDDLPYPAPTKKYGKDAQEPIPIDMSQPVTPKQITKIQRIVGSILYYARAVDHTVLMSLSTIAAQQTKATEATMAAVEQLINYCNTHPDAKLRYTASGMILNIHSDTSYLVEPGAKSRVGGHYFLGWLPENNKPIRLNGAVHVVCSILKFMASSAAEARRRPRLR